ncbi:MAG: 8-amino-7-oxononanoate synthase [Hyphomicrobiales bacterium]|nr:8-amino-7-oxononanoate synthase [Rickettsiales bacterium]MCP5361833.1 8-amino-7-oxononanoate synthase [Hyphomicrobiales bacterium]
MPALETMVTQHLAERHAAHLLRAIQPDAQTGLVSFATNDYLGLSQEPTVVAAGEQALAQWGAGAGASRLVQELSPGYTKLEAALAAAKGTEAALVFGSGYLAMLGVIPALVGKGDLVMADRLIHASMLDAVKLSGARLLRFSHNDLSILNNKLEINRNKFNNCLILTESVFSMDGDVSPLEAMRALADQHDAWLLSDDAHGFGVVETPRVAHLQMGTLSKAVGGYGGYVCCKAPVREYLVNHARTLIYSTALPPGVVASAEAGVRWIMQQQGISLPLQRARKFTHGLGLPEAESAIVPVVIGTAEDALKASEALKNKGFYVPVMRPPTVPKGTARLRFSFSRLHTEVQVEALIRAVRECGCVA